MRFVRQRFSGGQAAVLIAALACFLASRASAHLPCQVGMWTENDQICVGETADIWVITEECDSLSYSQYFFTASSTGVFTISNQCQSCSNGPSTGYLNIYVSALTGVTPSTASLCPGSSMTFTALDNSGTLECEPAWTVSPTGAGTVSTNGPTATFTLSPTNVSGSVTLSASCGTTIDSATITVDNSETFAITTQPSSQAVCPDSDVTLSVRATGNALAYQWRFNGVNLSDGRRFTGCTSSNLTISNVFTSVSACLSIRTDNHGGVEPCMVAPGDTYTYWAEGCTTFDANFTNLTVDPNGTIYVNDCTNLVGPPEVAPAGQGFAAPGLTAWSLIGEVQTATNTYYLQLGTNGTFQVPPSAPGFWRDLLLILNTGPTIHGNQGSWTGCVTHTVEGLYDCIVSSDCGSQISTGATLAVGTPCTTVISTNRLIDWTQAGVPGGVPEPGSPGYRTAIFTNFPAGTARSVIQDALHSCPPNQVVKLGSGTFTLDTQLTIPNSLVTLRGSTNTYLVLSTFCTNCYDAVVEITFDGAGAYYGCSNNCEPYGCTAIDTNTGCTLCGCPSGYVVTNSVDVLAGAIQGSTSLTISSTVGLAAGQIIGIDELADNTNTFSSGAEDPGDVASFACRGGGLRVLQQYVRITAINGTSNITISPALYSPYWSSNLTPQVFWDINTNIQYSSVEDLNIDAANLIGPCVEIAGGYACWVRNVTMHHPRAEHITTWFTKNCEFRHCTITDFPYPPSSGVYGAMIVDSSDFRFEDNIFSNYYNGFNFVGCSGGVVGYNYFTYDINDVITNTGVNNPTDNFFPHVGHPHFNLVEGNYARSQVLDATWGNSTYMTTFRNRFVAYDQGTNAGYCERLMTGAYYLNAVGNVLGTTGKGMDEDALGGNTIWSWSDWPGDYATDTRTNDVRVTNTLFRAGNWDVVSGLVWYATVPQPITNSLAYSEEPAWYTNECARCPWPPYDPNLSGAAYPTNIPAAARFFKQGS